MGLALGVAGCTTSGPDMGTVLAVAPSEVAALPAMVDVVPETSGTIVPLAAESSPPEVADSASENHATAAAKPDKAAVETVSVETAAQTTTAEAPTAPPVAQDEPPATVAALAPAKPEPAAIVAYAAPRPENVAGRAEVDRLIAHYSNVYEVPESLVRRVVKRESNFRPSAYNKGHWGLMQIKHATARGMGYKGTAEGLLDAETNLRFAVKYLRGAYMVAGGDHDQAVRFYARGYYYDAKRAGMLEATGLGRDRVRKRRPG